MSWKNKGGVVVNNVDPAGMVYLVCEVAIEDFSSRLWVTVGKPKTVKAEISIGQVGRTD